jgi:hypothetical protein
MVRENSSKVRVNLFERGRTLHHFLNNSMNSYIAPVEMALWVDERLPRINKFSILKHANPDLANG